MIQRRARSTLTIITEILVLLLALSAPSPGQSLKPGDRVRVVRLDGLGTGLIGRFVRFAPDSVWVRPFDQSQPVAVALGPRMRLDRSLGRGSRAGTGALIGAGVGAALTALFLSGFCGGDTRCDGDEQVRAAAIFGLPSVALGAGIGALIRVERWVPVPPEPAGAMARIELGVRIGW